MGAGGSSCHDPGHRKTLRFVHFWSEVKYNFAYFDKAKINRDSAYRAFIPQVLTTRNDFEYYRTIERFCALLKDGHTNVFAPSVNKFATYVPFRWTIIDQRSYVSIVLKSLSDNVPIGSELLTVKGLPTQQYLTEQVFSYIAASAEHQRRADVLNLSLNTPIPIKKWWNAYLYAGATWNWFRGSITPGVDLPGENFDERVFAFNGYMQHSFTLSKVWGAQVSGFWNAPTQQTIYQIGGLGALNVNVQKKVMQDRGRLSFGIDDVLNTVRWKQSGEFTGGANFDIYRKWESRRATVRFSYRFGNNDVKSARQRKDNAGADRIKTSGNL